MLEAGTNSYVTAAEADEYITKHYRSNSKDRQRWEGLTEEDKAILLINACAELETLPFLGRKAVSEQVLSFPRLPCQYGYAEDAPDRVKSAQIELALWLSDDQKQAELDKRQELQAQGVESFGIGDLSESYAAGAEAKPVALSCPKAAALLRPYLSGGYTTC